MTTIRAGLTDVARLAGVSTSTASRVLSGGGPASPASRSRVLDAAAALDYRPHPVARQLARGTGTRVVLAIRDARADVLDDPFTCRATAAIARVADRHGLGVSLRHLPLDCAAALAALAGDRSVAALVLAGHDGSELPRGQGRKHATIGAAIDGVPSADVDSAQGVGALVRHLLDQGRRQIALVSGPHWLAASRAPLRAYRKLMNDAGLPALTVTGDFSAAGGSAAARRILRARPDTDAIVAVSDTTALGVIAALREAGVRVPDDIAVTGFDDTPSAAATGLTSATHPVEAIATAAAEAALSGSAGPLLFPSEPVLRASCGGSAPTP